MPRPMRAGVRTESTSVGNPVSVARSRVRAAVRLLEAAADDADLGQVTPSAIAAAIRSARQGVLAAGLSAGVAGLLDEALESVEDGLPPDVTETFLDRADRLLR